MHNDQFKTKTQLHSVKNPLNNSGGGFRYQNADLEADRYRFLLATHEQSVTGSIPEGGTEILLPCIGRFLLKTVILHIANAFVRWNGEEKEEKLPVNIICPEMLFPYT